MREKLLLRLADAHSRHPWIMLGIVGILTLFFAFFASRLTVTMRWSDLLPAKDHRTIEYNKIINEFTSASNIVVVAQGPEARIKAFADTLAPRLLSVADTSQNKACRDEISAWMQKAENDPEKRSEADSMIALISARMDFPVIKRVDYKNPVDFMKKHGLMLMKSADLRDNQKLFTNPNLPEMVRNMNDALETVYVGRQESLSGREKEDQAFMFLDGVQRFAETLRRTETETPGADSIRAAIDRLLLGDPYFMSYDKKALIMLAVPNFTVVEADRLVSGTDAVHSVLTETLKAFPDVQAGLTGMIPIGRDEMVYGMQSANVTSIIAVIAILILLILAFRMWVAPIFAIVNLLIGILWAVGLTAMTVGQLNIMTQMMAVILMGLGIDFSIHFISGFTEERESGSTIEESLRETFSKYGKGIITGGLTTACAFLAMLISSSRGMKEMGLVTGLGVLAVLMTTLLALPVFFVFRERRIDRKEGRKVQRDITFKSLGSFGHWMAARYRLTLTITLLLTAFMIWQATRITFDQNYMHMEPKGLPSVMLQDTIVDKFDMSMDYALVLADSPEESRNLSKQYRALASAAMTEDIGAYLPSAEEQGKRRVIIQKIRNVMSQTASRPRLTKDDLERLRKEVQRLMWNIMEIQDMAFINGQDRVDRKCAALVGHPGDTAPSLLKKTFDDLNPASMTGRFSAYQKVFAPAYRRDVLTMTNPAQLTLDDLPSTLLDRYANRDTTQFLISVYPKGSIWTNMDFLKSFSSDLEQINLRATGMPIVFQALIEIIGADGRRALALTVLLVFILLWIDFGHPRYALVAMIPLIAGTVWMVGLMKLTGMQFTVINVMGLPMIIGIGIDDGVHIVHRWLHEGRMNLRTVFSSTGKAILLTSMTTMLAFGSLVFAVWRGFGSLGSALFLGVGACFVTTLLFLAGILGWLEKRKDPDRDV